jgi:hypothetical protein
MTYSGADDVGRLRHDYLAEDLVAEDDPRQHQDVRVPGARVAELVDLKWRAGVGEWPVAQQRPISLGQDRSLGVGVLRDLLPERLGLLDLPTHRG